MKLYDWMRLARGVCRGQYTKGEALRKTFKGWAEDVLTNADYFVFHFRMMLTHCRSVLFCAMNC